MMHGQLVSVQRVPAGVEVLDAVPAGESVVPVVSALDVAEDAVTDLWLPGGTATLVSGADHEANTLTLMTPLLVPLEAGEWLGVVGAVEVVATVSIDGEPVDVTVPHELRSLLPDRFEAVEGGPAVLVDVDTSGALTLVDVVGSQPGEVWGDPDGKRVEITDDGLAIWSVDDPGGDEESPVPYRSTLLGGPGGDQLLLSRADGTTFGIDEDGVVIGDSADFAQDILVGGVPLLGLRMDETGEATQGWMDSLSVGVVARQKFAQVDPARPANQEWGYATLRATMRKNRIYRIGARVSVTSGVADSATRLRLRVETGGNAPTITSTEATRGEIATPIAVLRVTGEVSSFIGYAADTDATILLTYEGVYGATPSVDFAELWIEDVGASGSYGGGSLSTGGQTSGGGGTGTVTPTVREYTTTWAATSMQAYTGSGAARSSAGELIQGYTPYYPAGGVHRSACFFDGASTWSTVASHRGITAGAALTGATITKAEVRLTARHWHSSVGGRALLGHLSGTTLPSTLPSHSPGQTSPQSSYWPRGATRWVTLPASWFSLDDRILTVGGGSSTSTTFYGRFEGSGVDGPRLRLTYTR